jgi:hypothetical protein
MRLSVSRLCYVVLLAAAAFGSAQAQIDPEVGALVLFDRRDFVTVEGFQNLAGKSFKTEVVRNGVVVGAAWSIGSGGDVAAEVNHPGGECWGADEKRPKTGPLTAPLPTQLKVTPDIRAGDLVRIRNENDLVVGGHAVLDVSITSTSSVGDSTFVVEGKANLAAPGVAIARLECRIIQPEWVDTFGRRDARALPGPIVDADKGGYRAGLDVDPTTGLFVAQFIFTNPADRELAVNGGGPRIMAWMDETPDGERLGLTIHEFGELGGPGLGGCPASPDQLSAPTGSFAAKKDGATVTFSWTKPEAAADASEVVGYYMAAMEQPAADTPKQRAEVGKRVMDPASGTATVAVDTAKTYDYELRSINKDTAFSKPFVAQRTGTTGPVGGGGTPPPALAAGIDGNVVTFAAADGTTPVTFGEGGSLELWYTISVLEKDNPVTIGPDTVAFNASKYDKPITLDAIEGTRWIHWIVFNKDGLYKSESAELTLDGAPAIEKPPTLLDTVIGQEALTVRWETSDTNIAKFDVEVFDRATGGIAVGSSPAGGLTKAVREYTVTKLPTAVNGVPIEYWVTVRGVNAAGKGEFADRKGPVKTTGITDKITISAAGRWRAGKDFRADGTASDLSATISLCRGVTDSKGVFTCTTIPGADRIPVVAGVAGASPTWTVRMSNGAVPGAGTVNPMYAISTKGGKAGPVTLAARRLRRAM